MNESPKFDDDYQCLLGVLAIDGGGSASSDVVRYGRNTLGQLFFHHKFGVNLSEVPEDAWHVVHTLVVGRKDERTVGGQMCELALDLDAGPQNPHTAHQQEVDDRDHAVVGVVPKQIQGDALNGVKDHQHCAEAEVKNRGE